jgi:hypothetical protein
MKAPTILVFVLLNNRQIQQSPILNKKVLELVIVTNSNHAISNSFINTIYMARKPLHMQVHFLDVYNSQISSKYKSFLPFQDYMFKEISQINHVQ